MSGTSNIVFKKIPSTLLVHGTFVEINSAGNAGQQAQRTLIIGQKLASGTALANVATISAGVADAAVQNGVGSMLHLMTAEYRNADNFGEVWYLPLADDPNSVAASLLVTIAGSPTVGGVIPLMVAGVLVPVAVTAGLSNQGVVIAIANAIDANPNLPITAAATATSGVLQLTAKNKGLAGNEIDVRLAYYGTTAGENVPAGLTFTNLQVGTGTQLAGGAQNPTVLAAALANLADQAFDFVVFPYTDTASLNAWQTFMDDNTGRWSWDRMLYGGGFSAFRGTLGACTTFLTGRNDPAMAIMPFYDAPQPAWIWAARLTGDFAVSSRAHPSVPVQDITTDLLPPPIQNRWTLDELQVLLQDGGCAYTTVSGQVVINRMVTTYQLNAQGLPDVSYQDVESRYQLAYAMRDLRGYLSALYSRKIWVDDNTRLSGTVNNAVAMPSMLKASVINRYRFLEAYGVVQDGDAFEAAVQVQKVGGLAKVYWPGDLANQLRDIGIAVYFSKT